MTLNTMEAERRYGRCLALCWKSKTRLSLQKRVVSTVISSHNFTRSLSSGSQQPADDAHDHGNEYNILDPSADRLQDPSDSGLDHTH